MWRSLNVIFEVSWLGLETPRVCDLGLGQGVAAAA